MRCEKEREKTRENGVGRQWEMVGRAVRKAEQNRARKWMEKSYIGKMISKQKKLGIKTNICYWNIEQHEFIKIS
jgi:hypothetical protein